LTVETVIISSCWWRGWASSVTGGQDPVLRHLVVGEASIRLQSPSSRPSNPRARRVTRRLLISCVMRPVLTAAESAVMHIISAYTIDADTILSIRYTQYRIQ